MSLQSVASELLEAFRTGEGVDLIRESVRLVVQDLIEVDVAEQIGAGRYERTDTHTTERNGPRLKLISTQAGAVELAIPEAAAGLVLPRHLERRRRIDQALYAVVMEAWVNGVSTRAVDDLVAALGIGSGISISEVSRICAGLDQQVEAFRSQPLHNTTFPYVFLDATYLHVRRTGPGGQARGRVGHLDGGGGGDGGDRGRRPGDPRGRHRRLPDDRCRCPRTAPGCSTRAICSHKRP